MRKLDNRIDELEAMMLAGFISVDCPVTHLFAPGMYIRTIKMKKGMTITSLIHKTIHPYFIMQGKVAVFSEVGGGEIIKAPYNAITYCGTRRILKILEETIWSTVHLTNVQPKDESDEAINEAVDKIYQEIIEVHKNEFLGGVLRNNEVTKELETTIQSPSIETT